jgi:hypothetical protein
MASRRSAAISRTTRGNSKFYLQKPSMYFVLGAQTKSYLLNPSIYGSVVLAIVPAAVKNLDEHGVLAVCCCQDDIHASCMCPLGWCPLVCMNMVLLRWHASCRVKVMAAAATLPSNCLLANVLAAVKGSV